MDFLSAIKNSKLIKSNPEELFMKILQGIKMTKFLLIKMISAVEQQRHLNQGQYNLQTDRSKNLNF